MTMFNDKDFDTAIKRTRRLATIVFAFNMLIVVGFFGGLAWLGFTLYELGPQGIGEFFGQIMHGFDTAQGGKS